MAQDAFLQAHPDVVEAFTRAIYKGQQWVESHSAAEIAKVIQPQFAETDLDTLTTIVERYQKQDTWKTDPTVSPEGFVLIQKIMMEGKELSQEIPYDSIVVTEFAEKVMTGKKNIPLQKNSYCKLSTLSAIGVFLMQVNLYHPIFSVVDRKNLCECM